MAPTMKEDATVRDLRSAVEFMDALSYEGFSEIAAIARLALTALERPEGYESPERIAQALQCIVSKADYIQDGINSQAEQVGCNYVDEAERLRSAARRASMRRDTSPATETALVRGRDAEIREVAAKRTGRKPRPEPTT